MVTYLPRKVEGDVEHWLERGKSVVLVGPRRAGKTTLLQHLSQKHGWRYVSLDDPEVLSLFKNPKDIPKFLGSGILLIDEAQYHENIGRTLKYLHDIEGIRFVASGSGSFDIKVKVSGELVGRAARIVLLPLSFFEFVRWKAEEELFEIYKECREAVYRILKGEDDEPPVNDIPFQSLWREYMVFGGYPEVVLEKGLEEKRQLLSQVVVGYIDRDIMGFLGVREFSKFLRTVEYVARTVSTPLKKTTLSNYANASFHTIDGYLSILELTYIMFGVQHYQTGAAGLRKPLKFYFYDQGVLNHFRGNFAPLDARSDAGVLLENFVARQLKEEFQRLYYWRSKSGAEVDFITNIPIEVKMHAKPSRALRNLSKKMGTAAAIIAPQTYQRIDDIHVIPPWFL